MFRPKSGGAMKRILSLTIAILIVPFLGFARAEPGKDDSAKIQGNWVWAELEQDGKKMQAPAPLKFKFGPDKIELVGEDDPAGYKLGVDKDLGTIDVTPEKGGGAGKTRHGLYELTGDDLKICLPEEFGKARPKDFNSKDGNRIIYLKREK
jgi:uncharacterized protein (TIGR03067 family)